MYSHVKHWFRCEISVTVISVISVCVRWTIYGLLGYSLLAITKRHCVWRQRRKYFLAIQNGTVSIRKWRKQLRRISWIQSLFAVTLTRVFVENHPVWSGFGVRIRNILMVSVIRGYCEKAGDTSAVAFIQQDASREASPRSARFLRRVTPVFSGSPEFSVIIDDDIGSLG